MDVESNDCQYAPLGGKISDQTGHHEAQEATHRYTIMTANHQNSLKKKVYLGLAQHMAH